MRNAIAIIHAMLCFLSFQLSLTCIAMYLVYNTSIRLQEKEGLPLINQIASWLLCG